MAVPAQRRRCARERAKKDSKTTLSKQSHRPSSFENLPQMGKQRTHALDLARQRVAQLGIPVANVVVRKAQRHEALHPQEESARGSAKTHWWALYDNASLSYVFYTWLLRVTLRESRDSRLNQTDMHLFEIL